MRRAQIVGSAVWDFIAGDDWRTAVGAALALGLTALTAQAGSSAWWILPPAVLGLLALSIRRAAREASPPPPPPPRTDSSPDGGRMNPTKR